MRSINPKVYSKDYYLNVCLGSKEFQKSKGNVLHPRLQNLLKHIPVSSTSRILDVGCGRGDISLFFAQKAANVVGIDYSKDAIAIANSIKKNTREIVRKKLTFFLMNVKKLDFPDNYFDIVIAIDVLEHLYKEEAEKAMQEISRVLKKGGLLFIHTGSNKFLCDIAYPGYILPMNKFFTKIDQIVKGEKYLPLPDDPRIPEEKEQHVNEPTYYYIKSLLKRYRFSGKIQREIGYRKPITSWRSHVYNAVVTLYPLSKLFPLNILFTWVFLGTFKNDKL